jgi:uncharacterized protein
MQLKNVHSINAVFNTQFTIYLLVAFGGAWIIWLPLLIAEYAGFTLPVPSVALITLGSFVPSGAALFLTWRYSGKTGLLQLLQQVLRWRVSPLWYLFAIAGPALIMLMAMGGYVLLGGTAPDYVPFGARWLIVIVNFVLVLLIGGPLGEEFGWRGLALPALDAEFGALWGSLLLGVIWTVWHLPLFFISASAQHGMSFLLFALLTLALCILMTWVYHGSGDSLLLVMLFHAAVNTWSGPLKISPEATGSTLPFALVVILAWVAALLVASRTQRISTSRVTERTEVF